MVVVEELNGRAAAEDVPDPELAPSRRDPVAEDAARMAAAAEGTGVEVASATDENTYGSVVVRP